MCGIAGYFGTNQINSEKIESALSLMKRRGPDYSTFKHWTTPNGKNVYLLHSRLNIIDLNDRSNQPLQHGSHWIAFNGELYNYIELKNELLKSGHQFRTQSDTEVLLQMVSQNGIQSLDRCEGMWAFALYNEADGSLLLSRDRFGEKPLYILKDETGIYFGSEIKFLFALRGRNAKINYDHLYRFLINGYKSIYKTQSTFFEGLSEVPSSTVIRIDQNGGEEIKKYWQPQIGQDDQMTFAEAVQGARDRLIRAVEIRLRADVPLAFCMSGGVDSNSLISIAKRVFDYQVHGFTIVNTDTRYEEQDMVNHVIQELGIRHTPIPVNTKGFLEKLRTLVRQHDAPVFTIAYYAHWLLMQSIAANGYRISISGTGADELFTGYYDHHLAYLYEIKEEPALLASSSRAWQEHIQPIVRNPFLSNPNAFIENPSLRDHIFLNADEFSDYLRSKWHEPFKENRYTSGLLRNRMLNEIFHESVPVILHEDDLNAMYYSIENRSPYLDRELFEFSNSIPTRHLIQDGRSKVILREAMKGIVPKKILTNRRKVGFNAPIFSFLDVSDPEVKKFLLNDSPIFEHIRKDKISSLIEKTNLPNSESKFLFYFLSCKLFLEEFES